MKKRSYRFSTETFTNENGDPEISWMKLPRFEFLRDDPRYQELYEKAGLKAYDEQLRNKRSIAVNH